MCVLQKWKGNPYYKVTVIKTGNGKNTDTQTDRIESLEKNPCAYGQMIFDKGAKTSQWEKVSLFNKC